MAQAGSGTATEYRHGAAIRANVAGSVLISPLRIVLRSSPGMPMPGDKATISLTVSNAGAAPLSGVRPVLTFASGSAYCGPLAGPVPPAGAGINPNGGITFAWTVTIGGTGEIILHAVVTATVTGQGAVSADADRTLTSPTIPKFSASIAPNPLTIAAGQWFAVEVTISNTGGVAAMQIMPAIAPAANANLVVFKSGPVPAKPVALQPGEAARFAFTYSANGSGTVSFTATVSGQADLTPPGLGSRAAVKAAEKRAAMAQWFQETRATATAWVDRTFYPPQPPPPTERSFVTFDRPEDLNWATDGYAKLALSATRLVEGKDGRVTLSASATLVTEGLNSCAVTFSVPGDLTLSPTGQFKPAVRLVWPPRAVEHALDPRDWTPFRSFRADIANRSAAPLALTITLVDSRGYRYEEIRPLAANSATRIEVGFAAVREARVDLARLSMLEFAVDTTGLKSRPTLLMDRFRFELPPPPPPERRPPPPRIKVSTTTLTETGRTSTGTAEPAR